MTIFNTIKRRRSISKMSEERPTREQIERLLEAATHAPNHHKIEPWKFFVIAGKARNELGEIMAASLTARLSERGEDLTSAKAQALINKEHSKPFRSPILLAAVAEHPTQANVVAIENIEATAAAVQNLLLTAEEMGLACMWRTGDAAYDPKVKQWLGLAPEDHIVSFVYLGYPAMPHVERHPQPVQAKTTWLGWEEA